MSGTFRPPGTGPNPSRWKSCPWCHADFEADEAICVHCAAAYEAGRLLFIRADVALFVRQTDEVAIDAQERAAVLSQQARVFYATRHLKRPHEAREPSIPTMQRMHVLDYRSARICVDQAADCRRWLEATR